MKNPDTIGEFLLKEERNRESLRQRINESVYDYYTKRNLFGLLAGLVAIGAFVYLLIAQHLPIWGLFVVGMSFNAMMESKRNTRRIDAMVRLAELDRSEPVKPEGLNTDAAT